MNKRYIFSAFVKIIFTAVIIFSIGSLLIIYGKTFLSKAKEPIPLPVIMYHSLRVQGKVHLA